MWFRLRTEHDVPSYCCLHVSYVRTLLLLPCLNITLLSPCFTWLNIISPFYYAFIHVRLDCYSVFLLLPSLYHRSIKFYKRSFLIKCWSNYNLSTNVVFVSFSFRFLRCSDFPSIIFSAPFWVIAFQWPQFSSLSLRKLFNIHWHISVLIYSSSTFFSSFFTKV